MNKNDRVYIVFDDCDKYKNHSVNPIFRGVFSTNEKAQKYIEKYYTKKEQEYLYIITRAIDKGET